MYIGNQKILDSLRGIFELKQMDEKSKLDWLFADMHAFICMTIAIIVFLFATLAIIYAATGWTPIEEFLFSPNKWLSAWWLSLIAGAIMIVPFIIVIVLRINFTMLGHRRQFGYIFRWL